VSFTSPSSTSRDPISNILPGTPSEKRRWTNASPALLIALRPDPLLYHEALEVFNEINTFILDHSNNWSFDRALSVSAVGAVRSLYIRFWLQDGRESRTIIPNRDYLSKTDVRAARRVRDLRLEFNFKVQGREAEVTPLIRWGVGAFVLESFQICICHTALQDGAQVLIDQVNKALGVCAKADEVESNGYMTRSWKAAKGQKLRWNFA